MVNIIFFAVVAVVFILFIFDRIKEDKEWLSVMVAIENNSYKLNEKYAYLKENGIRCRVKRTGERGTDQAFQRQAVDVRDVQSVSLEVYYKDIEKAEQLLNN